MRFLILLTIACLAKTIIAADSKKVVCYYDSASLYRPNGAKFEIESIDPKLCTHLIYSSVGFFCNEIKVMNPLRDLAIGKNGFKRFNALRDRNPSMKTLIAIGNWELSSAMWSQMASSPQSRAQFIKSVVAFIEKYDFNGVDLNWNYPAQIDGCKADFENFASLVKEMRSAFANKNFILTAGVAASEFSASESYKIFILSQYLDFVNLRTYDFHDYWDSETGLSTPLYSGSTDVGLSKQLTLNASVSYWLSQGMKANQLVVGIATHGRTFTLESAAVNKIGAPTIGPGIPGPYSAQPGFLSFYEIRKLEKEEIHLWRVTYDEERRTVWAYRDNQWITYDNMKSIKEKAEYIKSMGLGGAMISSMECDDFMGTYSERYTIIVTVNNIIRTEYKTVSSTTNFTTISKQVSKPHGVATECTKSGNIPDPLTCEQFFHCTENPNGTYDKVLNTCPVGTCYELSSDRCAWIKKT